MMTKRPEESFVQPLEGVGGRSPARRASGSLRPRSGSRITICAMALLSLCALFATGCKRPAPEVRRPQKVLVAVAAETDEGRTLRLSGTVEAERSMSLSFSVPGTIQEVLVQEGQRVVRGQALARLDGRAFQDALGIAQAKANQAEDAYRRLEPLHRNATVPEVKWVEVESGVQQARLMLSMAKKNLEDAVLRAPQDSVVERRNAEPGGSALPGVPALVLVQTKNVLATVPVPERDVASVKVGQPAHVTVAALGRAFEGTVREVGVSADPLTRTYPTKIALGNPEGLLRVGMVVEVILRQGPSARAVVVPPEAVRLDEGGSPCVYVVGDGKKLRRQPVKVSGYVGDRISVAEGIAPGDRVVTSGTPMLADGMIVEVVQDERARN